MRHQDDYDGPDHYVGSRFFVGLGWAAVLTLAGAAIVVGFIALLSLRMS